MVVEGSRWSVGALVPAVTVGCWFLVSVVVDVGFRSGSDLLFGCRWCSVGFSGCRSCFRCRCLLQVVFDSLS